MTLKLLGLRGCAALGLLLISTAAIGCDNPAPMQESGVSPAPSAGATAGKAAAGGAGSSAAAGTGSQAMAGTTAPPVAGTQAGRLATDQPDDVDGGTAGSEAGAPAAGSGGKAAAAGSGGSAGVPGEGGAAVRPACLKQASQVVVVGDSYLNWITHTFPDDFRSEFGGEYRMYAVGGASMASGGIAGFVPDQLTQAIADDPNILLGVMTGGGNDILIADTVMYPGSDSCKDRLDAPMDKVCRDVIANAMVAAEKLMLTAAGAGIRDVIYLFYPHIPGGGFGGMNPSAILDYSLPMARDLCNSAKERTGKLTCHFIDLVPVFDGHPDWFADDGIHENELGSAAMAKEVVKLMKERCLAQPEASGCCTP